MHSVRMAAGLAALAAAVAGCSSDPLPSFISRPAKIELQCGGYGSAAASPAKDNLFELLGELHLGSLTPAGRTRAQPGPVACTAVFYGRHSASLRILIPARAHVREVYLDDEAHPEDTGTYPLKEPIRTADLRAFLRKYSRRLG